MPKLKELSEEKREIAKEAYRLLYKNVPNHLRIFKDIFINTFKCPKCSEDGAICFHGIYTNEKEFNVHVFYHFHKCEYFEDFFNHIKKEDLENYSIKEGSEESPKCPIPGCEKEDVFPDIHIESSGY